MKKVAKIWHARTHKQKALVCLAGIPLAVLLMYVLMGCPSLTPRMAMHRSEKESLVGPSKIIATEEINLYGMDRMLIGRTEAGYTLYGYTEDRSLSYESLVYRAKTKPVTILSLTATRHDYNIVQNEKLPIVLFAEEPAAVRAEMDIVFSDPYYEHSDCNYTLSAQKEDAGYILLEIPFDPQQFTLDNKGRLHTKMNGEAYEKNELLRKIGHTLGGTKSGYETLPVTLRLYDKNGNLLLDQTIQIHPYDEP